MNYFLIFLGIAIAFLLAYELRRLEYGFALMEQVIAEQSKAIKESAESLVILGVSLSAIIELSPPELQKEMDDKFRELTKALEEKETKETGDK